MEGRRRDTCAERDSVRRKDALGINGGQRRKIIRGSGQVHHRNIVGRVIRGRLEAIRPDGAEQDGQWRVVDDDPVLNRILYLAAPVPIIESIQGR